MKKLEVLHQILDQNHTLSVAVDDVKQNISTDLDIKKSLSDIQKVLKSISLKASAILDEPRAAKINQVSHKLRNCCDALMPNKKSADDLINNYNEWINIAESIFYLESISTANICGNQDADQAIELLELILSYDPQAQIKALASFILSRKLNVRQPLRAYRLGIEAFEIDHALCASITTKDAPFHNYVYAPVEEVLWQECPICHHGSGTPHFCAIPLFMANYTPLFNPVKLWMKCDSCAQFFAYNFPKKFAHPQPEIEELGDEFYMESRPQFLPVLGTIIKRILAFANGNKLLDVGAGTGELIAAALELGCEVEAVEISKRQCERLRTMLGITVYCADFLTYNNSAKFNMITMGDVLEHVTDPAAAIQKAYALLDEGGILWISTPNFESGFSKIMKHNDPMWNEPWHISYFSYEGLKKLLGENGFSVLDYDISTRFNGSMEVIARKI